MRLSPSAFVNTLDADDTGVETVDVVPENSQIMVGVESGRVPAKADSHGPRKVWSSGILELPVGNGDHKTVRRTSNIPQSQDIRVGYGRRVNCQSVRRL